MQNPIIVLFKAYDAKGEVLLSETTEHLSLNEVPYPHEDLRKVHPDAVRLVLDIALPL